MYIATGLDEPQRQKAIKFKAASRGKFGRIKFLAHLLGVAESRFDLYIKILVYEEGLLEEADW